MRTLPRYLDPWIEVWVKGSNVATITSFWSPQSASPRRTCSKQALEAEVDEVEVPTPAVWITMVRSVARRSDERQDGWYPEVLGMAGKWWVIVVRRSWGLQTFEERDGRNGDGS